VLMYDSHKIKITPKNTLPSQKNYILLPFNHSLKVSVKNGNINGEFDIQKSIITNCLPFSREYPCKEVVELIKYKPDIVMMDNYLDLLILVNMMHIHSWRHLKVNDLTQNRIINVKINPNTKFLKKLMSALENKVISYYDFTPLSIGEKTILLPFILNAPLYWVTQPATIKPSFEDYVKKYINIIKKSPKHNQNLFEMKDWMMKSHSNMVFFSRKINGISLVNSLELITVLTENNYLFTTLSHTMYDTNSEVVIRTFIININMMNGEVKKFGVLIMNKTLDYKIIKITKPILSSDEFQEVITSGNIPSEFLMQKFDEIIKPVLSDYFNITG